MQPQKYERSTDFTERDGSDTDHSAVNQEFDAAATSINQIRENLAKIQKDDGGLNSGIVTSDAIDSSVFDEIAEVISPLVQDAQEAATASINAATAAGDIKDQASVLKSQTQTAANSASLSAQNSASSAQSANQSKLAAENSAANAANASRLTIGTVSTGPASATIAGPAGSQVLNISIPKGDKGDKGDVGLNGADGAVWRSGATTPSNTLGVDGDYYLNTTSFDVSKKESGAYSVTCNIKGDLIDESVTPAKIQTYVDFSFNGVAVGKGAGTGSGNTAVGRDALISNTTGGSNTAFGYEALRVNSTGYSNTAVGGNALCVNTTGFGNTAFGSGALQTGSGGNKNTAVGMFALGNSNNSSNTALGYRALYTEAWDRSNATGIGANSGVTASNQVQLGDSLTSTYVYGTVQNRSDMRDKTDVRDTLLGLAFINKLRAVDYKWDMREDYKDSPESMPKAPEIPDEDATDEAKEAYELAKAEFEKERDAWLEKNKLSNITRDGSKKRNRWHHGVIAQEVKATMDKLGVDFGGYQDHSMSDGDDVLSIGYDELIAPLIKAVQELSAEVYSLKSELGK